MISSDNVSSPYAGNGVATSFAYGFPVTDKTQLSVYLTVVSTNEITELTVDADYTVNGVGNSDPATWTITYPAAASSDAVLPTGTNITILPNLPITQTQDFTTQGAFSPQIYEAALDKLTIIAQQQQEKLSRTVTIPAGSTETTDAATLVSDLLTDVSNAATSSSQSATQATAAASSASAAATSAAAAATAAAAVSPYDVTQYAAASTSAANTYTASLTPAPSGYVAGMEVHLKFTNANTGTATVNLNGLGAKTVQYNNTALTAGQIAAGMTAILVYDGTYFQLANPVPATPSSGFSNKVVLTSGTSWTVPTGIIRAKVTVIGAGGGGGSGAGGTDNAGAGGSSGAVAEAYVTGLTPGLSATIAIGAGGTGAGSGVAGGNGGTTSFTPPTGSGPATAISCAGGSGGPAGNAGGGTTIPTNAAATGGQLNLSGFPGQQSGGANQTYGVGSGADTPLGWGQGGRAWPSTQNIQTGGNAGSGYGSGGSGCGSGTGGAGAGGAIIIEY